MTIRIVIDGAAGSGKTTFLSCNFLSNLRKECSSQDTINIASLGFSVFSEMMQGAVNDAKKIGIIPPMQKEDWDELFNLIYRRGVEQYKAAKTGIFWYDRGLHFLKAFADVNEQKIPKVLYEGIGNYKYDYVFIFKPIESFDLSMINNGKFGPMSLEDRYNEFQAIVNAYKEFGHTVFTVPVFSNNLEENFYRRFSFIKERVPFL